MSENLIISSFPYVYCTNAGNDYPEAPFDFINGHFVSPFRGKTSIYLETFATRFDFALKKEDKLSLQSPIFPYKVTALHYFVLSSNIEGIKFCFENGVKFGRDCFGSNPLDYALASKN